MNLRRVYTASSRNEMQCSAVRIIRWQTHVCTSFIIYRTVNPHGKFCVTGSSNSVNGDL